MPRLDAEPGLLAERFRWVKLKDGAAFSHTMSPSSRQAVPASPATRPRCTVCRRICAS